MGWLVFWLALSCVAGAIAGNKGRSGFGFFLLAICLTPIIGILAAVAASPDKATIEQNLIEDGEALRCQYCAEMIKPEAKICKHCGRNVPSIKRRADTDADKKGGLWEWLKNN